MLRLGLPPGGSNDFGIWPAVTRSCLCQYSRKNTGARIGGEIPNGQASQHICSKSVVRAPESKPPFSPTARPSIDIFLSVLWSFLPPSLSLSSFRSFSPPTRMSFKSCTSVLQSRRGGILVATAARRTCTFHSMRRCRSERSCVANDGIAVSLLPPSQKGSLF